MINRLLNTLKKHWNKRNRNDKNFTQKIKIFLEKFQPPFDSNILIWEMGGFERILAKNAIIATAFKLRKYKPVFVICSGTPIACIQRGFDQNEKVENWSKRCKDCHKSMVNTALKYDVEFISSNELINQTKLEKINNLSKNIKIDQIKNFIYEGVNVGKISLNSFYRYMKGAITNFKDIKDEHLEIYRLYFFSSLVNVELAKKTYEIFNPKAFLSSHGIYTDYQPASEFFMINKVATTTWVSGYNKFNHYFNSQLNQQSIQLTGIKDKLWREIINLKLTKEHNKKLTDFFNTKYKKNQSVEFLNNKFDKIKKINDLKKLLNLNNKFVVCLFCHVNWDAGIDNSLILFENTNQWVIESIKEMLKIKDVDWLVKIHPSEKFNECIKGTLDVIKENFDLDNLPANIKIIDDKSTINTLGLYDLIDCGITICGTAGIELPYLGKPILLAGKAHYSQKGFTIDPENKLEYLNYLKNIKKIEKLNFNQKELAKKFAYLYFIKRQTTLTMIRKDQGHWGDLDISKISQLLPNNNEQIDILCKSIINNEDFLTN